MLISHLAFLGIFTGRVKHTKENMIFPGVCFVAFSPTRSSVCALPRVKRCGDGAWGLPVAVFVSLQLHPPRACRRPPFFTQHSLSED
jgi:hypothetical protein